MKRAPRRHAAGLSLPELMVALAIGMMLVLASISLLMAVRSAYLLHDDRARLEENTPYDQFAERIGCAPRSVSTIMGTLERMGVIRRERRRIEGVQGRGVAVYFINPHVAWNGSLDARKAEAAEVRPPLLTLMEGGKP